MLRIASIDMGSASCMCGRGWIYGRGVVRIGDGTWLSPGVTIHSHPNAPVRIGDRCDVGPGVEFVTGSHAIGPPSRRAGTGSAAAITLGNGCWVGAGSTILGGVSVGEGAIVAAGSVVTRDVPAHTLVAGVPAVVKRRLDGAP
jgi:maltose O-acetyltransferase